MPFNQALDIKPTSIVGIKITLWDQDNLPKKGAEYLVDVVYSNGEHRPVSGDLIPHLAKQQITMLQTLLSDLRSLAETQVLSR